ncbi:LytTR family transcriptional regulator [Rheinheimera sediminis]|uniref:LytTR family DNA-binding domain-containing protein n=1 Tax=Rheinheimera sp. YQF-1 TaxID=2499626 RepID=UPI000FDA7FC5|nr:LytTR family DNA-binding domain-containing protein [Rheinheimera sp. YQF-1]RVT46035.1 LytTR family transcriptional regulator [Rheinheimera sp. YQF-1]
MQKQSFEFGDIAPTRYFFTISVLLALLFALIDQNNELSLLASLLLWTYQSTVPMMLMVTSHMLFGQSAVFNLLNAWLKLSLSGVSGALLFVPLALFADVQLGNEPLPMDLNNLIWSLVDEAGGVLPPVVLCWISINAPWVLGYKVMRAPEMAAIETGHQAEGQALPAQPTAADVALQQLLPADKRGQLLYLKSELHYLSVVTTQGKSLILLNLRDAIAACQQLEGLQPHRSYWVSKAAIRALKKDGREGVLVLLNNAEIPVSRNKMATVTRLLAES